MISDSDFSLKSERSTFVVKDFPFPVFIFDQIGIKGDLIFAKLKSVADLKIQRTLCLKVYGNLKAEMKKLFISMSSHYWYHLKRVALFFKHPEDEFVNLSLK